MTLSTPMIWLIICCIGIGTWFIRSSGIMFLEKMRQPPWLERALPFVPPAVMAAIISSSLLLKDGAVILHPGNLRLSAALIAGIVAYKTKNMLATIVSGMSALWIINLIF